MIDFFFDGHAFKGEELFSGTLSFVSGHGYRRRRQSEQNWRIKFPRWGNFVFSENTSEPAFTSST
ncbi:MAG TPA: hypothetical protein DHI91_01875 [Candidatus Portnoybacteria bacterium]|nr:hypothetical protein [Candidatus Portnoybacteria bacterium]